MEEEEEEEKEDEEEEEEAGKEEEEEEMGQREDTWLLFTAIDPDSPVLPVALRYVLM